MCITVKCSNAFLFQMKKNVCSCNDPSQADRPAECPGMSKTFTNFHVAIFSGYIKVMNIKLCKMVLLIQLYLFIPLSVTFTIFSGHSSVIQSHLKMLCPNPIKLTLNDY